ncbi:MAG: hypothetical protein RID25_06230, partial [Cyclobacteriaceae bacterium]
RQRHPADGIDLHAQDILTGTVPRDGLALPDIAEKVVFATRGQLLNLELEPTGRLFFLLRAGNKKETQQND